MSHIRDAHWRFGRPLDDYGGEMTLLASSAKPKSGDLRIETLRGLAILAVVAHHATIGLGDALLLAGLPKSIIGELAGDQDGLLQALRMPLFTLMSGWVYALKPFGVATRLAFLQGKIRRILLPLVFVASATYFFQLAINGQYPMLAGANSRPVLPHEFWLLWFYRYGHLWFLHSLLVIFGVIAVIDNAGWMRSVRQWLFWVAMAAILPYLFKGGNFWSLNKVPDILVFFLAGVGINRFSFLWKRPAVVRCAWVGFVAAMSVHVYWKLAGETFDPWPHFVLAGTLGPICLLSLDFVFRPLVWLGGYSYTIYLYHNFGFALLRPFNKYLDSVLVQSWWLVAMIVAGLGLPIVIDRVVAGIPYVRTLVLGRKAVETRNQTG